MTAIIAAFLASPTARIVTSMLDDDDDDDDGDGDGDDDDDDGNYLQSHHHPSCALPLSETGSADSLRVCCIQLLISPVSEADHLQRPVVSGHEARRSS